jgi:hypothetical protein
MKGSGNGEQRQASRPQKRDFPPLPPIPTSVGPVYLLGTGVGHLAEPVQHLP